VVNPLLNGLGANEKKGNQLIQFGGTLNSTGATIVPVLVGYLMGTEQSSWTISKANPALLLAMAIFVLAYLVLFFVTIPEPFISRERGVKKEKDKHSALSFRHFIFGMVSIFIYVGVEVGIPNIGNLFMTGAVEEGGLGMDPSVAGTVVGTYWFLMLVGRLTGGILGSRFSSRSMLSFVSSIAIIFTLLAIFMPTEVYVNMPVFQSDISFGLAKVPVGIMFLVLIGLCTSVMWGSIFNLATSGLGKYTAAASGLFMVMVCGGGILPAIQAAIADISGYINSYWVVFAGLLFILYYAIAGYRNINKDISTQ